ncbi:MAG TPA: aminotransferase class I/II-fold pyridoxal phosphate-dependent enzyme [Thermoanaerobaculia bacterium]|nr:aminotransferase class I/II-fold pyridoxal phosphate-dependent enzyme [Thermoanaerobaculia bacterium]
MSHQNGLSRRDFQRLAALALASALAPSRVSADQQPLPVEPDGPVRLHFNENPEGMVPGARQALSGLIDLAWQYPVESRELLQQELARHHQAPSARILLGNGSSELLAVAAQTFAGLGRPLVIADPTYDALAEYAATIEAPVERVPLTEDWQHDLARMRKAAGRTGVIYVCNPNNPTGTITSRGPIRQVLENAPEEGVVIVDEAYHHYTLSPEYQSVTTLIDSHPNLMVLRTFSKIYGMAGLRCGYAVAQEALIRRLRGRQARNNLNVAALLAARASLLDTSWVERSRKRNAETRALVVKELGRLGFSTTPSDASFFMIDLGRETRAVTQQMRGRGVLVGRPFPPLIRHLRVSIGTPPQMERFLDAFSQVMGS